MSAAHPPTNPQERARATSPAAALRTLRRRTIFRTLLLACALALIADSYRHFDLGLNLGLASIEASNDGKTLYLKLADTSCFANHFASEPNDWQPPGIAISQEGTLVFLQSRRAPGGKEYLVYAELVGYPKVNLHHHRA